MLGRVAFELVDLHLIGKRIQNCNTVVSIGLSALKAAKTCVTKLFEFSATTVRSDGSSLFTLWS